MFFTFLFFLQLPDRSPDCPPIIVFFSFIQLWKNQCWIEAKWKVTQRLVTTAHNPRLWEETCCKSRRCVHEPCHATARFTISFKLRLFLSQQQEDSTLQSLHLSVKLNPHQLLQNIDVGDAWQVVQAVLHRASWSSSLEKNRIFEFMRKKANNTEDFFSTVFSFNCCNWRSVEII